MELTGWLLAGAFALLSMYFRRRGGSGTGTSAEGRTDAAEFGPRADRDEEVSERATDTALRGVSRYLRHAVVEPLESAVRGSEARAVQEDARDALLDLAYYARRPPEATPTRENLAMVIQEVVSEFTLATGTSVRFTGPDRPVRARVSAQALKDALFLLLDNAGRFGGGQMVEVHVTDDEGRLRIRVRDRGPGFGPEGLRRAFEPFWTTEPDALGLGLLHARRCLRSQGASVDAGDREGGGGEVTVTLASGS